MTPDEGQVEGTGGEGQAPATTPTAAPSGTGLLAADPAIQDAPPSKPEWLAEDKFWDGEKNALKTEDLYKSYTNLQGLTSKRWTELSDEDRGKIIAAAPKELHDSIYQQAREHLSIDDEFKASLVEGQAPEAYELKKDLLPDGFVIDEENGDPLFNAVAEVAKENHMPQELLDGIVAAYGKVIADQLHKDNEAREAKIAEMGDGLETRRSNVQLKLTQLMGAEEAAAVITTIAEPIQFKALETLVGALQPSKAGANGAASLNKGAPQLTEASLKEAMKDSRYWDTAHPEHSTFAQKVQADFQRFYGS